MRFTNSFYNVLLPECCMLPLTLFLCCFFQIQKLNLHFKKKTKNRKSWVTIFKKWQGKYINDFLAFSHICSASQGIETGSCSFLLSDKHQTVINASRGIRLARWSTGFRENETLSHTWTWGLRRWYYRTSMLSICLCNQLEQQCCISSLWVKI